MSKLTFFLAVCAATLTACGNIENRKPNDIFTLDHIFHYKQGGEDKSLTISISCKKWNYRFKDPFRGNNSPLIKCNPTAPYPKFEDITLALLYKKDIYYSFKRTGKTEMKFPQELIERPHESDLKFYYAPKSKRIRFTLRTVSYTHLTLPTILLV